MQDIENNMEKKSERKLKKKIRNDIMDMIHTMNGLKTMTNSKSHAGH